MLPQDSYNRENLVHFRDVHVQGATVAFCLPQLLPAQLLLTPSGFLTFKCSAKSLHSWGTPVSQWAWSRHSDSHSVRWLRTGSQTGKETRRCLCYWNSMPGSCSEATLSPLVTRSAPEQAPAPHEVLQTVDVLLEGKGELHFSVMCGDLTPTGESSHNQREPLND